MENLFLSWKEFKKGKRKKSDVQFLERNLENELFKLYYELKYKTYQHCDYTSFYITDPKLRHIHKAIVWDRIVHHAVYRVLYSVFDKGFIYDSYSCRLDKGTHKALKRLAKYTKIISGNYTSVCWALKLDIKKFFDSVDHKILFEIIKKKVCDSDTLWLLSQIIYGFSKMSEPRERERERERERN